MLLFFEVLSSLVLLYYYRSTQPDYTKFQDEISHFSSINLIFKAGRRAGIFKTPELNIEYNKETLPNPFVTSDPVLGYRAMPGKYIHTYYRRLKSDLKWRLLKVKVTINKDGSRWTGDNKQLNAPTVYIFGDSYVFGSGVNDEHTFAYLLQQARLDLNMKLFALSGYSLTQAYLTFKTIKDTIKPNDIIILGYAHFYNIRHVVAPSFLKKKSSWIQQRNPSYINTKLYNPKASLTDEAKLEFEYIQSNCLINKSYCEKPDPDSIEMNKVTAAIINYIADNSAAKVYLLHFNGNADDPVLKLIRNRITRVSALSSDFDYFIQDDIKGFDPHPGPYWHYAIYRKLLDALSN